MSDTITSTVSDISSDSGEAAGTKQPDSTGPVQAAPESGDTSKANGNGDEAGRTSTDDGAEGGKSVRSDKTPRWKQDIERLREDRRSDRQTIQQLQIELQNLKGARVGKEQTDPDPWSDLGGFLKRNNQELLEKFQEIRREEMQTQAWQQELQEAAKFVRSQKGLTDDDVEEIRDILREEELDSMPPMRAARLALALYKERHGVADKSDLKAKASMVAGQSLSANRKRIYSQPEMDAKIDYFMRNPMKMTPEDEDELRSAHAEGRIR